MKKDITIDTTEIQKIIKTSINNYTLTEWKTQENMTKILDAYDLP